LAFTLLPTSAALNALAMKGMGAERIALLIRLSV
jgi:hypothetical protein